MKLKKLLLTTLIIASPVAAFAGTDMKDVKTVITPPSGSDAGFYIGVYGGAQFDTDYGNKRQTFTGTPASAGILPAGSTVTPNSSMSSGWGGVGGIKLGYNFESYPVCDGLRLQPAVELEGLYLGTTSTGSLSGAGINASTSSSYNSAAWFANGILRFKNQSIVTPYIGIGVGGEYITSHTSATTNVPGIPNVSGINGSDVDFAGQLLAGFDVTLAPHWDLFTEYKFIDAIGTDSKSSNIAGTGIDYRFKPDQIQQHLITAGVKYNF